MFAIRVMVAVALPPTVPQELDYFWPTPLPRGSLVQAPVGKRLLPSVVVRSSEVARQKLGIKRSAFSLRKLHSVLSEQPIATEGQLALVQWLADHYASGMGSALRAVLPSFVLKRSFSCDVSGAPYQAATETQKPRLVITDPSGVLRRIETCVQKTSGQVLVLLPEQHLARHVHRHLAQYDPLFVSSTLTSKAMQTAYRAVAGESARVVVGTRAALFLPWKNLGSVLVEDPNHDAYKADRSPRLNAPDVARVLAAWHGAKLTFLAPTPGVTQRYLADRKNIDIEEDTTPWPAVHIAAMNQEREQGNLGFFARSVTQRVVEAYRERIPMLFYSSRRAYGTSAACAHCRKTARCPECRFPYRFWRTGRESMLICYRCATAIDLPPTCPACHAGPLKPSGLAGSQKIADALKKVLEDADCSVDAIPILDSDLTRSADREAAVLDAFHALEHPILVATQMVLRHRYTHHFPLIVIPTGDGLMTGTDYRTRERFIWQIEKLAAFRPDHLCLQTWDAEPPYTEVPGRQWELVLKEELKERKQFGWPPFRRVVRLAYRHADPSVAQRQARIAADRLMRTLAHLGYQKRCSLFGPLPGIGSASGQRWEQALILKHALTDTELRNLLAYAPGSWTIDVDPRTIA